MKSTKLSKLKKNKLSRTVMVTLIIFSVPFILFNSLSSSPMQENDNQAAYNETSLSAIHASNTGATSELGASDTATSDMVVSNKVAVDTGVSEMKASEMGVSKMGTSELGREVYHWGFKKSRDHQPPTAGAELDDMLERYESFYLGDTSQKSIYLTFDNGYEQGFTSHILDILLEKDVPAAFFITGHYLKDQPELVKRMVEENHIVGNHSWHHPDLTTKNSTQIKEELTKVDQEFAELTGKKGMTYLRPPRGIFSERTLAISSGLGYRNVFWSLAYVDWQTDQQKGWQYAYDNIMSQIHPGAVLLLHTVSEDNAQALATVIDDLRAEGYVFKSLDDLIADQFFNNFKRVE